MLRSISLILATAFLASSCSDARGADRITDAPFATRSEVIAPHAMAATSQPLATQIALDVMKQGGSAVDAAIAADVALGLMEPTGAGVGGDLFAMVWDAKLIQMERAMKQVASGDLTLKGKDTVYLTTADPEGNMVSQIQSNYVGMGSGMAPEGLGFILQDRGQQFSLEPGHANVYAPGKRPFHTIIPAFITKDGAPWVSFGVMGGDMQPQGHVQIVINLIDFGMNLQEAGDAPRIYWETSQQPTGGTMTDGGKVNLESGFSETTLHALQLKRHVLGRSLWAYGGYQAIQRLPGGAWAGASESRKDGQAAGY